MVFDGMTLFASDDASIEIVVVDSSLYAAWNVKRETVSGWHHSNQHKHELVFKPRRSLFSASSGKSVTIRFTRLLEPWSQFGFEEISWYWFWRNEWTNTIREMKIKSKLPWTDMVSLITRKTQKNNRCGSSTLGKKAIGNEVSPQWPRMTSSFYGRKQELHPEQWYYAPTVTRYGVFSILTFYCKSFFLPWDFFRDTKRANLPTIVTDCVFRRSNRQCIFPCIRIQGYFMNGVYLISASSLQRITLRAQFNAWS